MREKKIHSAYWSMKRNQKDFQESRLVVAAAARTVPQI